MYIHIIILYSVYIYIHQKKEHHSFDSPPFASVWVENGSPRIQPGMFQSWTDHELGAYHFGPTQMVVETTLSMIIYFYI